MVGGICFRMSRKFRTVCITTLAVTGAALIGTSFVPKVHADQWDKMTIVTVHEPIIAGNKVLDPGTYVWKLLDSQSDRHIVQIFDKDQQRLETTVLAIPDYRMQPTGKNQFAFWETPAGVPKAVRDWFYPGDNFGQEFPYPKKLVAQLASAAPAPVPSNYHEPEPAPAPQPEAQPEAAPQPGPAPAPAAQAQPAPEPQAQPEAPRQAPAQQPSTLPHTGSFNPLVGLLGLVSLSSAGLLTLARRRY
jgi:LPXTG-motif cell wall-anchored protein